MRLLVPELGGTWRLKCLSPGSQAELSVEQKGHQATHKTFDTNFVLSTKCTEIKMDQKLREETTNDYPNERSANVRNPTPGTINDSLSCLPTEVLRIFLLRGFTQQEM